MTMFVVAEDTDCLIVRELSHLTQQCVMYNTWLRVEQWSALPWLL